MEKKVFTQYPDISYLREKVRHTIARFAINNVDDACDSEINLRRNTEDIWEIRLMPFEVRNTGKPGLGTVY